MTNWDDEVRAREEADKPGPETMAEQWRAFTGMLAFAALYHQCMEITLALRRRGRAVTIEDFDSFFQVICGSRRITVTRQHGSNILKLSEGYGYGDHIEVPAPSPGVGVNPQVLVAWANEQAKWLFDHLMPSYATSVHKTPRQ